MRDAGTAAATRPRARTELDGRIAEGRRFIDAAFGKAAPLRIAAGEVVLGANAASPLACRLSGGWACRAIGWSDGRRAIIDIYMPGDIIGIETALFDRPHDEVVAITALGVRAIDAAALAELMTHPAAAAAAFWVLAEQQRRVDRLTAALARRDAHERLALMLTDLHDRLRQRGLIAEASYPLPLTQQQIGDHLGLTLVHVNRVLRSLREKRIVSIDRHVVTIRDLDRLRQLAASGRGEQQLTVTRPLASRERLAPDHAELGEFALS
ncbi:MAG: Crp/Fnr family transcriptional regulator [Stellaceae bacterium]